MSGAAHNKCNLQCRKPLILPVIFHNLQDDDSHLFIKQLPKLKGDLGGNYMRPGRTQTGMSSYRSPYISFHVFTCDRPENELRPA